MIAHLVLFTPRASLSSGQRTALLEDLERACRAIPHIRRARVGRRRRLGYAYDAAGPAQFEYLAVLEFDSTADLHEYLQHPSHAALGRWFREGADVALAHDFETSDVEGFRQLVAGDLQP